MNISMCTLPLIDVRLSDYISVFILNAANCKLYVEDQQAAGNCETAQSIFLSVASRLNRAEKVYPKSSRNKCVNRMRYISVRYFINYVLFVLFSILIISPPLSLLLCAFIFLLIHCALWKPRTGKLPQSAAGGRVRHDVRAYKQVVSGCGLQDRR